MQVKFLLTYYKLLSQLLEIKLGLTEGKINGTEGN
jgi:hypothetical protein